LSAPSLCKPPEPIIDNTLASVTDEPWDVLLDQRQILDFMKAAEQKKRDFKKAFRKMDLKSSFRSLFFHFVVFGIALF
jgi:hypothetical protein